MVFLVERPTPTSRQVSGGGPPPHFNTTEDKLHSFAVRTLLGWYRDGVDVAARMPLLSTYLGHVHPANAYWYLSAAPELLALVAARLDTGARR